MARLVWKHAGVDLIRPAEQHLTSYLDALERGWLPNDSRPAAGAEDAHRINTEPQAFLDIHEDRTGQGPPVTLTDGSTVPRLPGIRRWIWDGEFSGSIGLRWQAGTPDLPPWCLGHIGYSVVPWKRNRGYATVALRDLLPEAREAGLPYVDLVTDLDNIASQRVIVSNGGVLVEEFTKPAALGAGSVLRYRIATA
jgi:predicted acetyltransferase